LPRDVGVVVVAAGHGDRLGGDVPKQFRPIAGVPLLLRALRPFLAHPDVADVVAVLPPEAVAAPPAWLAELLGERLRAVPGGDSRMDSVEAGLRALPPGSGIVLVHDGARPFPDPSVIAEVIDAARRGAAAIAAIPLADTIKESANGAAGGRARVLRTLPRERLWRAQTPQGFPRALLEQAYAAARAAGYAGTDCASLVERLGEGVLLIPDTVTNFKVTTVDDLRLAEAVAAPHG
jgi:2-C-methyl-D-erythritol 4-phosphate cytidylyltransferase